jgi:hypothetical protein
MNMSLLPPSATSLERAASLAMAPESTPAALRTLYRPSAIAPPALPWLAWAFDAPLWPDDLALRRSLVAESWRLHRQRGTLGGLRAIARYLGADITRAIVPPAKSFASPALTRAERNAFVARYPQLRIFRHRSLGSRVGIHCGDPLDRWQPAQSDALLRIQPRAYLWRDGAETELTLIERTTVSAARTAQSSTVTEAAIPGAAGRLSFAGRFPRYLTVTEAARRFYRITLQQAYQDSTETLRRVAADPGLSPIDVRPDTVAQPGQATGVHAGQFVARYITPSTARDRLYQRLYLYDPDIDISRRTATLHLNAGRLGMPAHHAELSVRIPGVAHRQSAGRYVRGYLVATAKSALTDSLQALRFMARGSDRIVIDTAIKRPATAGASLIAGALVAGAWTN